MTSTTNTPTPKHYRDFQHELPEGQYLIPGGQMDDLMSRLEKLNKRAHKLGCEPIQLNTLSEHTLVSKWTRPLGEHYPAVPVLMKFYVVTVSGAAPKLNGWEFLGTLQHEEAGNVVRMVPTYTGQTPVQFRTAEQWCDQCRMRRQRNDTYLVRNETTGEWKQIGRNCLRDFLGHASPEGIATWCSLLADLHGFCSNMDPDEPGMGGGSVYTFPLVTVLTTTRAHIRQHGWMSKAKAMEYNATVPEGGDYKEGTASQVWRLVAPSTNIQQKLAEEFGRTMTEQDAQDAEAAAEWACSLSPDVTNDYLWNVRVAALTGYVTLREIGIACSIMAAWMREQDKQRKAELDARAQATRKPSEWVGVVGKRQEMTLTVESSRVLPGEMYTSTLLKFRDDQGNTVTWFASGAVEDCWPLGETFKVKATVKAHNEFRGWKETLVQRVATVATKQAQLPL